MAGPRDDEGPGQVGSYGPVRSLANRTVVLNVLSSPWRALPGQFHDGF